MSVTTEARILSLQMIDRLLDDDPSEIAGDVRATVPRLHHLWGGTARRFDLTIDDSDEDASDEDDGIAALIHGTPCRYAVASTCWAGPRPNHVVEVKGRGGGRD